MDPSAGRIGKYEILKELGRGGFAVVYKACDTSLDRIVALKVLHAHVADNAVFVQRFRQEARTAAQFDHAHIVTIYEVGEKAGQHYIAMQYLPGKGLDALLEKADGPLPIEQCADIVTQIAEALDYIHQQGAVHRDVKPSNIIVNDVGHATLLDFGIVRAADGTQLTATGELMGTPQYMSPEQAEGQAIDHRSDIYALGVVAYQLCTGKAPFDNVSPLVVLRQHADKVPPAPRELNPDVPEPVEAVLLKALAKRPDERYQSARDFARALQAALAAAKQTQQRAAKLAESEVHEQSTDLLAQPISVLELRTRAENLLLEAGIETVGDVLKRLELGDAELTNVRGFGAKSLADLKAKLRGLGFVLPAEAAGEPGTAHQKAISGTRQRKNVRQQRQTAETTLRPLSPWNPLDQFRLLWWLLVVPQRFRRHSGTGEEIRNVGGVLTSTLTWSPLFLLMLALGLETLPHPQEAPSYFGFLFFTGFLWLWTLLTTSDEFWAILFSVGLVLAGLIGFAVITESVGAAGQVNFIVLGTAFSVVFVLAFIVALVVAKGAVFLVPGGAACSALGLVAYSAFGNMLTGVARIAALGAVLVVVGFITFLIARNLVRSVATGRPSWLAHGIFGVLVITYAFLIWFSFLGGWRIFQ